MSDIRPNPETRIALFQRKEVRRTIPSPKAEPFKRWLAKVGYEGENDFTE